jgi:hypothetical protein
MSRAKAFQPDVGLSNADTVEQISRVTNYRRLRQNDNLLGVLAHKLRQHLE